MIASFEDRPRELHIAVLERLPANEIHGIGHRAGVCASMERILNTNVVSET